MMAVASFLVISFAQFLPKSVGRPVSSRMPSFLRVLMFFWAFSFEMLPAEADRFSFSNGTSGFLLIALQAARAIFSLRKKIVRWVHGAPSVSEFIERDLKLIA